MSKPDRLNTGEPEYFDRPENEPSSSTEGVELAETLMTRRRFSGIVGSTLVAISLAGCPEIDIDNMDIKEEGEDDKKKEKTDKKEKLKDGELREVESKKLEELSPKRQEVRKRLLKEKEGSIYDERTGNVICTNRHETMIDEPLVEFRNTFAYDRNNKWVIEQGTAKLKKSAAMAFLAAQKELGKPIILRSTFRTNETQDFFYERAQREKRKYPVGRACYGEHEVGQSIDVHNYKEKGVREALLKHGFLDNVCDDPVHFTFRKHKDPDSKKSLFNDYEKGCSKFNHTWYYGTGKMGKVKRKVGKTIHKVKKTGRRIRRGARRLGGRIRRWWRRKK